MIEQQGDLFTTSAKYIGHGVNCRGLMGAGIAKEFRNYWPHNYFQYKEDCKSGRMVPGAYSVMPGSFNDRSIVVVNFASQFEPGPDARYSWLFSSLVNWAEDASDPDRLRRNGGIIAVPEIGCGIGGLDWKNVKSIMKCVEGIYPNIEFEVWHYVG